MINLKYWKNKEQEEKYYNLITNKRKNDLLDKLEKLCKQYMQKSFRDIVLLSPADLKKEKINLDNKSGDEKKSIQKSFHTIGFGKKKKDGSREPSDWLIKTLYEDMPKEARLLIYKSAGVSCCPYCNRNFVDIVKADDAFAENKTEYRSAMELDHFYDKDSYPMFAVSLYNLIPVCSSCNKLKLNKSFWFNPYDSENGFKDMHFTYEIKDYDFLWQTDSIDVKINCRNEQLKENIQGLYLEKLYQNHKDMVMEIVNKVYIYGEGYADSLLKQTHGLFSGKEEIYRFCFGNYLADSDFGKRPLSKFTRDIVEETMRYYGIHLDYED